MNRLHRTRLTIGTAALLAALTACSGSDGSASGGVAATPPDGGSAAPSTSAAAAAPEGTSGGASDGGGSLSRCALADLTAELSSPVGSQTQRSVRVVWTNSSGRTCTMTGFGGADVRRMPAARADLPEPQRDQPDSRSLRRAERTAATVRLAPGDRAHSTLTYGPIPSTDVNAFVPDVLVLTPPDETHSVTLPWTLGGLDPADGATRPVTYLGPVETGAA